MRIDNSWNWHTNLSPERRKAISDWVESLSEEEWRMIQELRDDAWATGYDDTNEEF
jgi:hypothetical protein